jgi:hypothetical protein
VKAPGGLVLAGVVVLGAGFAYGYAVAAKKVFPHRWIAAVVRRVSPAEETPTDPLVETRMETGWWQIVRQPGGPSRDEILEGLDALGYMQSYREGESEYGVTVHDKARSQPGHNLIVSAHEPAVLLADMDGEVLHEWSFSFDDVPVPDDYEPPGVFGARCFRRARLLEGGELLAIYDRMGLIKLDQNSQLIWSLVGFYHHDLDVSADGTIHVLTHETEVVPRIHETRRTFEDFVTRVSPDGKVVDRFSLLEALERSRWASLLRKADPKREDVFHTNTIEVFDGRMAHLSPLFREGMILVSIWGLDAIAIVDPDKREVVWALSGMWHRQHEPVLLDNGNILLFDNMGHRGMSKVIEFEPFTQRVVWSYDGDADNDFYSELCGSSARLSNGNTLITESLSGRAFEVAPNGDVVWRWLSPYRVGPNGEGVAVLMEVIRLEPGFPLDWR